jgi:hypothetical protein
MIGYTSGSKNKANTKNVWRRYQVESKLSSEMSVDFQRTTRRHITLYTQPRYYPRNIHLCQNKTERKKNNAEDNSLHGLRNTIVKCYNLPELSHTLDGPVGPKYNAGFTWKHGLSGDSTCEAVKYQ